MIPYNTEDEAVEMANDTVYGLSGYVQSSDINKARTVANQLAQAMCMLMGQALTSMHRLVAIANQAMAANGARMALKSSWKPRLF